MASSSDNFPAKKLLFTFSFFEGAAVMVCELLAAKMIAPFFGSSLYVWASVLGVTLTALMSGYYLGGYVSSRYKNPKTLYYILGAAGLLLIVMPHIGSIVMSSLIGMSVQAGSTLSLVIFMLPPLLLMGMTSPVIIDLINEKVETSGKSAGSIYAISTFGGIIATFLIGFYMLPEFGIRIPAYIFGAILVILSAVSLFKTARITGMLLIFATTGLAFVQIPGDVDIPQHKVIYESEGVMGQVKVIEQPFGQRMARWLFVNNTGQSFVDAQNPEYTLWGNSIYYPTAASTYPEGSNLLLLGLGGGMFYNQFDRLGFNIDAVELDGRIKELAVQYFGVSPQANIIVDDARHYINTCEKKYNVVMMDLFLNETPPGHVLSKEAFEEVKRCMVPDGMIMINFYGYLEGDKGKAARSIIKTLQDCDLGVKVLPTPGEPKNRNLIILAAEKFPDFSNTRHVEPHLSRINDITSLFVPIESLNLEDAEILTDEVPAMESMYVDAALEWRQVVNEHFTKTFIENDLQPFH